MNKKRTVPVALQLYSVRGDMEQDFEGTLRAVGEMGYDGWSSSAFTAGNRRPCGKPWPPRGSSLSAPMCPMPKWRRIRMG